MAETKIKRHPLAIAWDEWLASDEGQQAKNVDTLARYTDRYLENRLKRAFDAGAKATTPASSDFEQLTRLRDALQEIADRDTLCTCEHDTEFCCVRVKEYCAFCIAATALDPEALAHRRTGEPS